MEDKNYRIGFALSDARIAPLNPDSTYGEGVPLPTASQFQFVSTVTPGKDVSISVADVLPSYTMTWRYYRTRKHAHAAARRRARALARQRSARSG